MKIDKTVIVDMLNDGNSRHTNEMCQEYMARTGQRVSPSDMHAALSAEHYNMNSPIMRRAVDFQTQAYDALWVLAPEDNEELSELLALTIVEDAKRRLIEAIERAKLECGKALNVRMHPSLTPEHMTAVFELCRMEQKIVNSTLDRELESIEGWSPSNYLMNVGAESDE